MRKRTLVVFALVLSSCTAAVRKGDDPAARAGQPGDAVTTANLQTGNAVMTAGDHARLENVVLTRGREQNTDGYLIGPDDLLEVRIPDLLETNGTVVQTRSADAAVVAQAPVFQQGVRVGADGNVHLPLIGVVRAEGLSTAALEVTIADRLKSAGILRAPQVSVQVAEYRSRVVAVVGSVERPGLYPVTRPGATVGQMIWAAGGPTKDAGRVVEFVPAAAHQDVGAAGQASAIRLDLDSLLQTRDLAGRDFGPPVRPGDVISLRPAGTVQVEGWVEKPGSYPVTRGLTLSGAIAAAGGSRFAGDRTRATLIRTLGSGQQQSFSVDLGAVAQGEARDIAVTDGDVVQLPADTARLVPWGVWTTARDLVRVGGSVLLF